MRFAEGLWLLVSGNYFLLFVPLLFPLAQPRVQQVANRQRGSSFPPSFLANFLGPSNLRPLFLSARVANKGVFPSHIPAFPRPPYGLFSALTPIRSSRLEDPLHLHHVGGHDDGALWSVDICVLPHKRRPLPLVGFLWSLGPLSCPPHEPFYWYTSCPEEGFPLPFCRFKLFLNLPTKQGPFPLLLPPWLRGVVEPDHLKPPSPTPFLRSHPGAGILWGNRPPSIPYPPSPPRESDSTPASQVGPRGGTPPRALGLTLSLSPQSVPSPHAPPFSTFPPPSYPTPHSAGGGVPPFFFSSMRLQNIQLTTLPIRGGRLPS